LAGDYCESCAGVCCCVDSGLGDFDLGAVLLRDGKWELRDNWKFCYGILLFCPVLRGLVEVTGYFAQEMVTVYYFLRDLSLSTVLVKATLEWGDDSVEIRLEEEWNGHAVLTRSMNDAM
jgi:hypothetical protein